MSAVRTAAKRGVSAARRASNPGHRLPRRAYAHCFIEQDGVHSRLHLHHFYSLFLPDIDEPVTVHVRVHDATGTVLGELSRTLTPFSSLTLPMAEVLAEIGAISELGTVAVDVEPGDRQAQRLVEVGPPEATAQSPFWMGFHDDRGSIAYVHSIDQYYGAVFGVGPLARLAYRSRWHRGGAWTSKRLVDAQGLLRADAYLVNHSPEDGRTTVRWIADPDGPVVAERIVTIAAHGVARVTVDAADLSRVKEPIDRIRLEVDDLLTGNGKPYVMLRYGDGPFSLHHG